MVRRLSTVTLALAFVGAPAASAYTPPPTVQWVALLPGLPTASNPQFPGCPGMHQADHGLHRHEIRRMDALRVKLGCDHRAVFATTYELLTITLRDAMRANPHLFKDPTWVIEEDAVFAEMYFRTFSAYQRGKPIPAAWRVAFDTAGKEDANAVQDMLLGINAHVQRDMPHMLAAVGMHASDGSSRKPDHDKVNDVLNNAYARVVDTIATRFDPYENYISPGFNQALGLSGNIAGDQLAQTWREAVWRHAELLLGAATPVGAQLAQSAIESNAEANARLMASYQLPPGYRAQRDAYCAAHNVGPLA